jgi:hypothetical protein
VHPPHRAATIKPRGDCPPPTSNIRHPASSNNDSFLRNFDPNNQPPEKLHTPFPPDFSAIFGTRENRRKKLLIGWKLLDSPENREHNARW